MAKISKPVDRLVPSQERSQVFTNADATSGDILDILNTLGRAARLVRIETAGSSDLAIRRNVIQTIYPDREEGVFDGVLHGQNKNLAQGQEVTDSTIASLAVGTDEVLNGPVKDLEITWSTGTWTIVVS